MNVQRDEILIEAGELAVDSSRRVICPWCQGGDSHELTMSITRTADGVLYNCHRATCGQRGFAGTAAWTMCETAPTRSPLKPYTGTLMMLQDKDLEFFQRRYELSKEALCGAMYVNDTDEYVLPITWLGRERGFNVRQPWFGAPRRGRPGEGRPKSKVWMHSEKPVQSAYSNPALLMEGTYTPRAFVQPLVIVEDQLSAIKAVASGRVAYAVALMGTHLNIERVREIAELRPDEVIIALDADATQKSFTHARDFGLAFRKTRVALLAKDIKDTLLKDIPAVLGL